MRWRWAYYVERCEPPFDFKSLVGWYAPRGLMLPNPGTHQITRLSAEGDQIVSSEEEIADRLAKSIETPFQWWLDDGLDVFCDFRFPQADLLCHVYEVGILGANQLNWFVQLITDLVKLNPVRAVGCVIEPLHYGDYSEEEWLAFLLHSAPLPTLPQLLIVKPNALQVATDDLHRCEADYFDGFARFRYPTYMSYPAIAEKKDA
ncbi:MAG: hypothetical protein U0R19_30295 [Bryobacteraceae bacterium]